MKLSYDYTDLYNELVSDIEEGLIDINSKIYIERETMIANHFDGVAAYSAIIDYYFDNDDISDVDGEWMTVKGVLFEMEEMNKLL